MNSCIVGQPDLVNGAPSLSFWGHTYNRTQSTIPFITNQRHRNLVICCKKYGSILVILVSDVIVYIPLMDALY